ncbi:MAG: hypothetical protein H8D49_05800 [Dehalococcoidia bacterium]|nr:hypothetical protein [Dehalococcoidia bacterium]
MSKELKAKRRSIERRKTKYGEVDLEEVEAEAAREREWRGVWEEVRKVGRSRYAAVS